MEYRNIIWIIVDSVRNYTCPAQRVDDRGRIELMNDLADSWIDFRTVVTSAPSTVMSISAMLSSCPAYYLGSNFLNMRLQNSGQPNVASILKPLGYRTYCITLGPNERGAWDGSLEIIPRRLWPADAVHRKEWNNPQINQALESWVQDGLASPFFFLLHYNCRGDDRISENVERGLQCLDKAGLLDNSVVFLTSDHGYPDPLRKDEVAKRKAAIPLKHRSVAHDLVLTDDNVLVPLLIRYPGFQPQRIEHQICTLDYLPTSLELAGIKEYPPLHGTSFMPLLQGHAMPDLEDRKVRIDGRFLAQTGRCTAIRNQRRKYIYYADESPENREQFFDLTRDELEITNLIHDPDFAAEIDEFREFFRQDEQRSKHIQASFMRELFLQELGLPASGGRENTESVLFVRSGRERFDEIFENVLGDVFGDRAIHSTGKAEVATVSQQNFDWAIGGVAQWGDGQDMCRTLAPVKARRKVFVNLNTNVMQFSRCYMLSALSKDWQVNKKYYKVEPLYWLHSMLNRR